MAESAQSCPGFQQWTAERLSVLGPTPMPLFCTCRPDAIVAKAKGYVKNNDYARAIETYLSLTVNDTANHDALEQVGTGMGSGAQTHHSEGLAWGGAGVGVRDQPLPSQGAAGRGQGGGQPRTEAGAEANLLRP